MSFLAFCYCFFFFFNDTATPEIYTLSLHDALPLSPCTRRHALAASTADWPAMLAEMASGPRSEEHTSELQSHLISYAVFCLKKKKRKAIYKTRDIKKITKTNKKKTQQLN